MHVLLTFASRHGATAEIGERIAKRLVDHGIQTTIAPPDDVATVDAYDAVVIGSAVYAGRWLAEARDLVDRVEPQLVDRAVWLVSSGPVGDPLRPDEEPVDVPKLRTRTGARGHRVFAGRLERSGLGLAERAVVRALRVPEGDYRDWDAVEAWADDVADALGSV